MKPNNSFSLFGKEFRKVDFGTHLQNLQADYLDMYEGIQLDIVSSSRLDENSDISMTYLGKIGQEESLDKLKAEEPFPISESGYTLGRLLDGTKNVSYFWIQVPVNPLHQSRFICIVNHCTPYQNSRLAHKRYR